MKTYSFPRAVVTVREHAFSTGRTLQSVRLNEGLRDLKRQCFEDTGLRRLILPSSIRSVGSGAFKHCENLHAVDARAAKNLKCLDR